MIDVEMVEILFFNIILQIRVIFDRIIFEITLNLHLSIPKIQKAYANNGEVLQ